MNRRQLPLTTRTSLCTLFLAAVPLISAIGCSSESAELSARQQQLEQQLAQSRAETIETQERLQAAQKNTRMLAEKVESLVQERDTLQQENTSLEARVSAAGEQLADVQTQVSEVRARSQELNQALEMLDGIISGTSDAETGVTIVPRTAELQLEEQLEQAIRFPQPPALPVDVTPIRREQTSEFTKPESGDE